MMNAVYSDNFYGTFIARHNTQGTMLKAQYTRHEAKLVKVMGRYLELARLISKKLEKS